MTIIQEMIMNIFKISKANRCLKTCKIQFSKTKFSTKKLTTYSTRMEGLNSMKIHTIMETVGVYLNKRTKLQILMITCWRATSLSRDLQMLTLKYLSSKGIIDKTKRDFPMIFRTSIIRILTSSNMTATNMEVCRIL